RSPLIVEYSLHLREALQRGDETASDHIEHVTGFDPAKPVTLAQVADRAFTKIAAAYQELIAAKPQAAKKRGARKPARAAKKFARSAAARRRIELSRRVRAFVFTPATERRIIAILHEGAEAARPFVKKNINVNSAPADADRSAEFDVTRVTARLIASGVISAAEMLQQSRKVNAAFEQLSYAKQAMTEANLRLV